MERHEWFTAGRDHVSYIIQNIFLSRYSKSPKDLLQALTKSSSSNMLSHDSQFRVILTVIRKNGK
jgi:hypothetical protein